MRALRNISLKLLMLAAAVATTAEVWAFRPGAGAPPSLIEKFEERFVVDSQCERYELIETFYDGRVEKNTMLMAYQYGEDYVLGLIRILPKGEHPGNLALSIQRNGETPKLYAYDFSESKARLLEGPPARATIGNVPWHFEDMIDDDKEPWDWKRQRGTVNVEGFECSVLVGNWGDPEMRYNSSAGQRRLYVALEDPIPKKMEFYDRRGNFFKTIWSRDFRDNSPDGQARLRAHRIEVRHNVRNSHTVMVLAEHNYDVPLPAGLFDPDFLPQWSLQTDAELLAVMRQDD
ncbi:MAG: outer membrane lipoprotein-sorting protein [Opitutales bacterium]